MTSVAEAVRPYAENFESMQAALAACTPDWLAILRHAAFARFAEQGFPSPRAENWKYTPTRPLEKRAFSFNAESSTAVGTKDIEGALLRASTACTLVFVNGCYSASLSRQSTVTGLRITVLDDALQHQASQLEQSLVTSDNWEHDPFTLLNTAFLQHGVTIELDAGTTLTAPLQLLFVSSKQSKPCASHPRIVLRMGKHSAATLVETWQGLDGADNFANSYTQIELAQAAQLEHLRVQREAAQEFHVSRVMAHQQANSRYASHTLNIGGRWVRTDLHSRLEAPDAETQFNGLYIVDNHQHVDNHTRIDHAAPDTRSDELYRGIVAGNGHAVFNGKVVVAEHAVHADAAQVNNNLLLSRNAEIDTKPELEIYADDVKCSHGATVGQLDEQALFYLRSRGLGEDEARSLLTGAFALSVLDRIVSPVLRDFARAQIRLALPGAVAMEAV
ncbi:MAG TPA: Fe-S cluster assembly protein SufD [Gammaproteobacteria bacterium]|nr:Fe-S cluster assembly protein SufD [Gammaproteobacteria bacterium]